MVQLPKLIQLLEELILSTIQPLLFFIRQKWLLLAAPLVSPPLLPSFLCLSLPSSLPSLATLFLEHFHHYQAGQQLIRESILVFAKLFLQ